MKNEEHDELKLKAEWEEKAKSVKTTKDLKEFVDFLIGFNHGYGTIVHAMAIAMNTTMRVIDRSPNGGITGFQASCIGWEMVEKLFSFGKGPKRILAFHDLLYPQSEHKFNTISKDTWEWAQKEAQKELDQLGTKYTDQMEKDFYAPDAVKTVHPKVENHWKSIAAGNLPFGLTVSDQH